MGSHSSSTSPSKRLGFIGYLRVYLALCRVSIIQEMQFKTNFLLWIVVEGLWFTLQLAFMSIIYQHTDSIAGWSQWQVVMLVGCNQFIQQVFSVLFMSNLNQLSEQIRTGKLDFYLLLPINTRFLISLRKFEIGNVANALMGFVVVIYAGFQLRLSPSISQITGFLLLCLVGLLIHYSLMSMLACISFWTVRAQGIVWGYYNLFNIARLPDAAFSGVYRAVFSIILPVLLVSNVPVKTLLDTLGSLLEIAQLLGLALFFILLSEWFWRFSIRRYTSASS